MSIKGFKLSNGSIVRYDYSALDNIVTDDSLSVPGVAADSKTVGDEIAALEARNFDLDESDRLKISGLSGTTSEVTDRIEQVRTALGTEVATRMAADASFEADMVTERTVRAAADNTEKSERVAADSDLLTRINIEKSRIDNIEALPDGATTADAELVNIRIGYDNTEYSSAGEAVRTQISDVKADLSDEETARIALAGRVTTAESDIDTLETHKVAQPLDDNNQPTDGTNGQLLRTKGDGTTEWTDVGLPTDEQTAQAVSDWLDNHPEATTTVQDHSLTYHKLVNGTLGFVTPEMYGAVGDGETDDTIALNACLSAGRNIRFNGDYYITGPVYVRSNTHIDGNGYKIIKGSASAVVANANYADEDGDTDENIILDNLYITTDAEQQLMYYGLILNDVKNVNIKNLTVKNLTVYSSSEDVPVGAGAWATYISGWNITINGVYIYTYDTKKYGDGLHLGSCKDVSVSDFNIWSSDDSIVLAPISRFKKVKMNFVSENVEIGNGNCHSYMANCIRFGDIVEVGDDVMPSAVYKNCVVHDIVFEANERNQLVSIIDPRVRGTAITEKGTGIVIRNIKTFGSFGAVKQPIAINGRPTGYDEATYDYNNYGSIILENINIQRLTDVNAEMVRLVNVDEVIMRNVTIENGTISSVANRFYVANVKHLEFHDCSFIDVSNSDSKTYASITYTTDLIINNCYISGTNRAFNSVSMPRPAIVRVTNNQFDCEDMGEALVRVGGTTNNKEIIFYGNVYDYDREFSFEFANTMTADLTVVQSAKESSGTAYPKLIQSGLFNSSNPIVVQADSGHIYLVLWGIFATVGAYVIGHGTSSSNLITNGKILHNDSSTSVSFADDVYTFTCSSSTNRPYMVISF